MFQKREVDASISSQLKPLEEKLDDTAFNSAHLSHKRIDCFKKVPLTGQSSKPRLVSAQAVLSSKTEPESFQDELLINVENACESSEDTDTRLNSVPDCSESNFADSRKPNDEKMEKKQVQENTKERNVADKKSTFARETGVESRKSIHRAEQRERWMRRRKERLGQRGQSTEVQEDQVIEMSQEIRSIQKQWRSKERQDEEPEKDAINLKEIRGTIPHHILSRYSFASSSSSSSASFNHSSAESDEVFSEGEEMARRKDKRRCRSWRTFLTMMQWSRHRQNSWVQLAGHQGNIQQSEGGEVLKRFNEVEDSCLQLLMSDPLQKFVPHYNGNIIRNGEKYIRLEDLLSGLKKPAIMDCKIGIRTFQELEIKNARAKSTMRSDMYQKMMKIDPMAPTEEEHAQRGVTKLRYMQWRDSTSSTSTLGLRIEGIMMDNGVVLRDFHKTRRKAEVTEKLLLFSNCQVHILKAYLSRLKALKETLKESAFFSSHEVIGGSLLFIHDCSASKANIWMIDFAKTTAMPENLQLKHDAPWVEGNREDGYLTGLESLTSLLKEAINEAKGHSIESHQTETETSEPFTINQPKHAMYEKASQTC